MFARQIFLDLTSSKHRQCSGCGRSIPVAEFLLAGRTARRKKQCCRMVI